MKLLFKLFYILTPLLLIGCSTGKDLIKEENKITIQVESEEEDTQREEAEQAKESEEVEEVEEVEEIEEIEEAKEVEETRQAEEPEEVMSQEVLGDQELEAEILRIRDIWDTDSKAIKNKQYEVYKIDNDITAYASNGTINRIEIQKNTNGTSYSRTYNFSGGQLVFAYIEASDSHRLYFKNDSLFRWRYTADVNKGDQVVNYDNRGELDEFNKWESFALNEARKVYADAMSVIY